MLRNSTDAQKFAAALTASPRSFLGRTAIGSALDFAMGLFAEGGIAADRKVIDVSGDGTSNQGRAVTEARDAAVKAGAIINGLSIFNRRAAAPGGYLALHTNPPGGLAQYYRDNVIGGLGAFVLPIDDFGNFGDAMIRKLTAEIASRDCPLAPGASERLDPRPEFELPGPGAARLAQGVQIGLGDRLGIEQRLRTVGVLDAAGAADSAVDDEMGDMDAVRRELARQALRRARAARTCPSRTATTLRSL